MRSYPRDLQGHIYILISYGIDQAVRCQISGAGQFALDQVLFLADVANPMSRASGPSVSRNVALRASPPPRAEEGEESDDSEPDEEKEEVSWFWCVQPWFGLGAFCSTYRYIVTFYKQDSFLDKWYVVCDWGVRPLVQVSSTQLARSSLQE